MALSDILSRFRQSDAEYDEEGYEDEGYDTSSSAVTQAEAEAPRFSAPRTSDKVISLKASNSLQNASVKIVQPTKYEEIMKEPVRFLRENKSVILNLEKVNSVDSRKRIVDFMAGVCAAIDELPSAHIPLHPAPLRSAEICLTARSSDEPRYAQRGRTLPFRAHRRYAETGCKVRRSAVLHVPERT